MWHQTQPKNIEAPLACTPRSTTPASNSHPTATTLLKAHSAEAHYQHANTKPVVIWTPAHMPAQNPSE